MTHKCTTCGRTKSQAIAEARAVGLMQGFLNGIHTCCKIAQWADEQWLAWFEATHEDDKRLAEATEVESHANAVLVPIRRRRLEVRRFREPDDLSR